MVVYQKADIEVISAPIVVYECPFCGHRHIYSYDWFKEKYGNQDSWKYRNFVCRDCGKMFCVNSVYDVDNIYEKGN